MRKKYAKKKYGKKSMRKRALLNYRALLVKF